MVVACPRLFGRLLEFFRFIAVLFQYFNQLLLFLELDFVLLGVSFTLLLYFGLLLINLRINLFLDLTGRLPLLCELISHLLRLVLNFSLELFVLLGQFVIFLSNLLNGLSVLGVFFIKLLFDTFEVLVESLLNLASFVAFLLADLDVTSFKLLVLLVVLASKDFVALLHEVSLLSPLEKQVNLLIQVDLLAVRSDLLLVDLGEEGCHVLFVKGAQFLLQIGVGSIFILAFLNNAALEGVELVDHLVVELVKRGLDLLGLLHLLHLLRFLLRESRGTRFLRRV